MKIGQKENQGKQIIPIEFVFEANVLFEKDIEVYEPQKTKERKQSHHAFV
jgi:hypothetical protein